jgi:hypothetical protein
VTSERYPKTNVTLAFTVEEESMQSIGALVRDLLHSDNAKVDVALKALYRNLKTDKNKCENIVKVGGCLALFQLVKNCLEKVIENGLRSSHRVERARRTCNPTHVVGRHHLLDVSCSG